MKKERYISLADKIELLANLSFYEHYFDGKANRKNIPLYIISGLIGAGLLVCSYFALPLILPALCFVSFPIIISYESYKNKKNIIKKCGFGVFKYKDYKQMKKSGEIKYIKDNYSEEIKERTRFGILNGNMEIFKNKKAISEQQLEEQVTKVFGPPINLKTEKQLQEEKEMTEAFDRIFKPNRRSVIHGQSKKENDLER